MTSKNFKRGAVLLHLAASALLPAGPARAGDVQTLLRHAGEQLTRSAAEPDPFGRTVVSSNYYTRAMGEARRGRGKGGKAGR